MISIVLATYNEKEHITSTISELLKHNPGEMEIIVVDDDSPDKTWKLVEEMNLPNVKLIRRLKTYGLASAFNRGIIETSGDYIGWMDADMSMPPFLIPKMYEKIVNEGFDIVIGSRYAEGGCDDRNHLRIYASRLINGFASLVLGYGIKDYDSGFVLVRRSVFDYISIIPRGYGEYFIEFIYNACKKGLRVTEIGYYFRDRTAGISKSAPSIYKFFNTGMWYIWRIITARLRRVD